MVMQTETMEYQNDYGFTSSICYPFVNWAGEKGSDITTDKQIHSHPIQALF